MANARLPCCVLLGFVLLEFVGFSVAASSAFGTHKNQAAAAAAAAKEGELYLHKLFSKYGENGVMTFEGFEHLLESLGLGKVKILDHDIHDHHADSGFVDFHETHNHTFPDGGSHGNSSVLGHHDHGDHELDSDDSFTIGYINGPLLNKNPLQGHDENITESDHSPIHLPHNHSNRHDHGNHNHRKPTDSLHQPDLDLSGEHNDNEETTVVPLELITIPASKTAAEGRKGKRNRDRRKKNRKNRRKQGNSAHATDVPGSDKMKRSFRDEGWPPQGSHSRNFQHDGDYRQKRHVSNKHEDDHHSEGELENQKKKDCLTATQILSIYHIQYEGGITEHNFLNLCPAIVYQIDEHMCNKAPECPGIHGDKRQHCAHFHGNGHSNITIDRVVMWDVSKIPPKVWGYAVAAVTVISLVGLCGVAMVPVMQKACYTPLLQFLVALAVGSLTGDALLHLLPHAMNPHEESDHDHEDDTASATHNQETIWKGIMVLAGIYFFFLMERFMGAFQDCRRRNKRQRRSKFSKADLDDSIVGEKLSRHDTSFHSCENIRMMALQNMSKDSGDFALDEHEGEYHDMTGHGGHGHSHGDVPESVADIAWMVIMGDGLHNFSDGLAIGAAFANSITGGLSTSVAVFCHELPHELGDFAVLLSAGMSIKQALVYNIVSSILCFIGMVIGVCLGNINEASLWIFCLTAGMFIYISLVDMLPEITQKTKPGQSWCCNLFLHMLGIGSGVTVMLLIALYEDKIRLDVGS